MRPNDLLVPVPMTTPYYQDDLVTIYHGDCREITAWLDADVMVTDPPYGRAWKQGRLKTWGAGHHDGHDGIANDDNTAARDAALEIWGEKLAVAFGDLMLPPPPNTKQVLVYRKPSNAGSRGATAGRRRDIEAVYLIGPWPTGIGGQTSIIGTFEPSQGNPYSPQGLWHHPHAKPDDVMRELLELCPAGVIADPFMGSGSTLRAAKDLGRKAIGVEVEERYCEVAARRMGQEVLAI